MHREVAVILPPSSEGAPQASRRYPIRALRRYSMYFDALLSERWLEMQGNKGQGDVCNSPPVVDLSQTDLDLVACTSVLRFIVSRYRNEAEKEDKYVEVGGNRGAEHREVTTEELKELLWEGFAWEEEAPTPNAHPGGQQPSKSDEEKLHQVLDYFYVRQQDEILTKLWAIKMVQCPCFLEDALKKQDLVGRRPSITDEEEEEMYIKKVPEYRGWSHLTERMWRFLVCLFMCRMLVYGENEDETDEQCRGADVDVIRARKYQRRLGTYNALTQLSYLSSGLGVDPLLLLREFVSIGLLAKEGSVYQQTSVDSQAMLLWQLLE